MDERERRPIQDRILNILLSEGGAAAERLREALDRAQEAEDEALRRLELLADRDPRTLCEGELAERESAIDRVVAADAKRKSAVRGALDELVRREEEALRRQAEARGHVWDVDAKPKPGV